MSNRIVTKEQLTTNQFNLAFSNSKLIQYWRANPVVACRDLLGIQLLDFQAVIFTQTWIAKDSVWVLTRNGSKTVSASAYAMLRSLLFPEEEIWIVSKSGRQAKKLFSYVERLATGKISEFVDLPDIYLQEVYRANQAITGFSHDPQGHNVKLLNGSYIKTLNGIPDNNRGERGTLVIFDECGFMEEEAIAAVEPFTTTEKSFKTSTDESFDYRALPKNKPSQRLYISSASDKTTYFYDKFYDFSLRMFAGDKRFYAVSLTVDVPLAPTLRGKKYAPLLSYDEVESMMNTNPSKAMREYYNAFDEDGGDDQIIKSHTIERNSTFVLPKLTPTKGRKYILGYDTAHRADNSILGAMETYYEDELGLVGDIINMINFKDLSDVKGNRQMLFQDQIEEVRKYVLLYNGDGAEYENIHKLAIDGGMGGGGGIYGSNLMFDWKDEHGISHRGMIDKNNTPQEVQRQYPNAYDIINIVEPTKWKPIMVERLIELMELGVIRFPAEYNNSGAVEIEDENGDIIRRKLSKEEILALINIDLLKEETKMIHRFKSGERVSYKLRTDMQNKMHDDRFYVLCLMANELYELREAEKASKHVSKKKKDRTVLKLFN
jgi:hypothetical protein